MTKRARFRSKKPTGYTLTIGFDYNIPKVHDEVHVFPLKVRELDALPLDEVLLKAIAGDISEFSAANGRHPERISLGWLKKAKAGGRARRGEVAAAPLEIEHDRGPKAVCGFKTPPREPAHPTADRAALMRHLHEYMREQGQALLDDPHHVFTLRSASGRSETYVQRATACDASMRMLARLLFIRAHALDATSLVLGTVGTNRLTGADCYIIGYETSEEQVLGMAGVDELTDFKAPESKEFGRRPPLQMAVIEESYDPDVWDDFPGGREYAERVKLAYADRLHDNVWKLRAFAGLPPALQVLGSPTQISWPALPITGKTLH